MASIFNYDNPINTSINKIIDMILLSIVYVIICIPIITIGPATTALYYTIVKNIRKERGYPFKEFFKCFKTNFKQGFIATIIFIVAYLILYIDFKFAMTLTGTLRNVYAAIILSLSFIVVGMMLYVFPYLSRFDVTIKQLFKNSFFLTIKHFPSTIAMALILVAGIVLVIILPVLIIIAPSLIILLQSFLMEKIFRKYMPEKSEEAKEQGIDQWYLD